MTGARTSSGVPTHRSPFGGSRYSSRCPAVRRRSAVDPHEVSCSTECYKQRSCERIGLLAPDWTSLFPKSLRSYSTTGPRSIASPGSSSRELGFFFRVLTASNLPHTEVCGASLGVCFPIATSTENSDLQTEFPGSALCSALSVSHALDSLFRSLPCGFVSPHNRVRD